MRRSGATWRLGGRVGDGAANGAVTCACRKLHPAILMVKPAQDGLSSELTEPLHLSRARRILPQGQMRSEFVVIAGVVGKDPAQPEDDDVIEACPADRAISLSACPFCQGDRRAVGRSRIPMAARRFVTAWP
jgi:hypothetical protein